MKGFQEHGHIDKTKGAENQGREVGMAGVVLESGGGKKQTTVFEQ